MFFKKITILTALIAIVFFADTVNAQSLVIDSLNRVANSASTKDRPVATAELARATLETNPDEAMKTATKAMVLAKASGDAGAKAFCYATLGYLIMQKGQEKRAAVYLDSATRCASKSTDKELAAFVWMRKGWFELVKGNNEKAISGLLKASQLIEDDKTNRAYSYKTIINHYIASIYAYGSDTLKHRTYARNCLAMAKGSNFADDMQLGYLTVAHSFFSAFEHDKTHRELLDSSMRYFRQAMAFYHKNREKIFIQSNGSLIALNIANSYFKYYPLSYKDSAQHYINIALEIGRKTNSREVIANCYGMLSEYALREKDYTKAEQYLLTGISEIESSAPGVDITRSRLMLALANVAEQKGDKQKALDYYKQYVAYNSKVFDAQKLAITQQLEEEYHAAQRDNEIARLRERANFNKHLNWLYVAIGSVSILVLALLLSSYHYKLKASQQKKQIAEKENEEIRLTAELQKAEAQRLMFEKQEAELQAQLLEEERAHAEAQQALLQDRTEWLEKELLAGTLKIEEKNAILELLKEKSRGADTTHVAKQIGRIINQNLRMDKNLDEQQALNNIHPTFFTALQERAGNSLTRLDLKYCAYILMGLDNKEIASRLGVEPKSIRMGRYRLKQKLNLDKAENLDQVIRTIA
ncbi:LuxR C-terminal-related transcriptional regulator [Mucilaginibacter sp. KACC 22063]|uniref:LuxR C-terminal-related transcriptional regulator n=1 Tax=Mucilaginibacter sp. KACC 22063 TaxID=3025666 RepID=UPI00236736D9|nr:LuxR C-terminal-related transcriptional regulator [Mucilaginibacter sp. KACC 22063]WDF53935.1 LuxR C-terminal-related transcriptional regulator [Mucilaginibacter sp. KACC 22063]